MAKIKEAKKRKKAGSATQSSGAARDYLKEGIVVMNAARGMVGDLELEYGKKYKKKGRRVKRNVSMAGNDATPTISFKVNRGGKQKVYPIQGGYGYFIPSLRKAGNLAQATFNECCDLGKVSSLSQRRNKIAISTLDGIDLLLSATVHLK